MANKIRIKTLQGCGASGKPLDADKEYLVSVNDAKVLIDAGEAVLVDEKDAKKLGGKDK